MSNAISLDALFDKADRVGTGIKGPRILYHYTTCQAAESILRSQQFRASAHDCTNDKAELASADATILDAVRQARENTQGILTRRVLGLFLDTYQDLRLGASRRAYLVCFSTTRDDPYQWCRYGARGNGVCLGLRLFGIPQPRIEGVATGFFPVDYRESHLRNKIHDWLQEFVATCDRAEDIEHNWRLAIDALNVTAAAWALASKQAEWEPEREVRAIFLAREGCRIVPVEEPQENGSIRRYSPVALTRLRRMPVEEFIIGPNQDASEGRTKALGLLEGVGYRQVERKVIISAAKLALGTVTTTLEHP